MNYISMRNCCTVKLIHYFKNSQPFFWTLLPFCDNLLQARKKFTTITAMRYILHISFFSFALKRNLSFEKEKGKS